jgi:FkbM family methyltransferase
MMTGTRWWNRVRFDLIEVAITLALACAAVLAFASRWYTPIDTDWLRDAYGPGKWSHNAEEGSVRDFFRDRRDGFFVDVGSADPRNGSNTYNLESRLGWSGIAVDALTEYADGYRLYRPRTRFFALFVGDRSDAEAVMYVSRWNTEASSMSLDFTNYYTSGARSRRVPTIRLTDLLDRGGVKSVDFLSMDIQLAEPLALAGFDIDRFRPALVCIETHATVRQAVLDYFTRHRYVPLGKYLWADVENPYFAPLDSIR